MDLINPNFNMKVSKSMFLPEMCYTLKCHKNRLYALEFEVNLEAGAKLGNFEGGEVELIHGLRPSVKCVALLFGDIR